MNGVMCYFLLDNRSAISKMKDIALEYKFQLDYTMDQYHNLVEISKLQYRAEGNKVRDLMLFDLDGDSIHLHEKLSENPKVFYYFPENGCPSCFEPILLKLDSIGMKIGRDNIIILAKFSSNRRLNAYWIDKPREIPIYRIRENLVFPHLSDDHDYAYAFLLDNRMVVHKFILTDKSNVEFSDNYFNHIIKYFQALELN
jgi:hypothetical protein